MIYKNPEFKKNIKLEFSFTRLLIPALVLLLTTWIGWSGGEIKSWERVPLTYAKGESLTFWMFGFGFIFSIVWGAYLASNSLFGEMRQKTWDFMRMSSLPPEKILFGKLFGSTSVVWTVTLLGILPIILTASQYLFVGGGYHRPVILTLASLSGGIIFWMILSYAFVMLAGIYTYSRDSRHTTIGAVILVLIAGLFVGALLSINYNQEFKIHEACRNFNESLPAQPCTEQNVFLVEGIKFTMESVDLVNWYNIKLFPLDVATLLIMFAACWSVVAVYRNFRSALQYRDSPIIWPIFLLTTAVFANGFFYNERFLSVYLLSFYLLLAVAIAPVCVKEARNMIAYKKLFQSLKEKNYKETYRLMPLWFISLAVFIIASPLFLLNSGVFSKLIESFPYAGTPEVPAFKTLLLFYISSILFIVRDVIVIHIISWHKSVRLPTVGIAVYLLLMYLLDPYVSQIIMGAGGEDYFIPLIPQRSYAEHTSPHLITYMAIHAAIIIALLLPLKKQLKKLRSS